ncbi:related to Putative oxidoreductase C1F5.03c [Ustilago trichophora]|uniref:Related to Putative oxidoreductase C1F5.03c n=1 Tax=Ustilago trichophora TaxID=86804 RepID=A0A5C3EHE4_9BASI|nr:related to Putative oxidoreductase C1F5.03c [Ustilago trichophora]
MTAAVQPTRSIVIVGGGIVGSSIAYYLSRAAASTAARAATRVTLVEASSAPAPGASGKAGGFLALDWHGAATASLAELSYKLHRELADQDGGHEKWGYRQVETWQVNVDSNLTDNPNKKSKSAISWLNNDIVRSTSNMGGGGSTAQVHPGQLTKHLVDESRKAGVEVLFNSRVTSLRFQDNRRVDGVEIKDARSGETRMIDVDDLVIAAGPWTGSLITQLFPRTLLPAHLKSASLIDGSRAHSVVIQSPPGKPLSADCLFTDMAYGPDGSKAGAPELYCRPDGTAYVCGGSDDAPLPDTADQVGFDEEKVAALIEQSKVLSPSSLDLDTGATLRAKQSCYLPISNRTGNPIIGGKDGVYVAAGHSCWGITNSLGTGKVMSELIVDGKVKSANIRGLMP